MNIYYIVIAVLAIVYLTNKYKDEPENSIEGQSFGTISQSRAGQLVRSKGEMKIANFLEDAGILYIYEPQMYGLQPDFYLPETGLVIEYWGLITGPEIIGSEYRRSMNKKLKIYRKQDQLVISIMPEDLKSGQFRKQINNAVITNR